MTGANPATVRAKVWLASGTEPAAWTATTTDATAALQIAGGVGPHDLPLRESNNAANITRFDDFQAGPTGVGRAVIETVRRPPASQDDGTAPRIDRRRCSSCTRRCAQADVVRSAGRLCRVPFRLLDPGGDVLGTLEVPDRRRPAPRG